MNYSSKDIVDAFGEMILSIHGQHQDFECTTCPDTATASSLVFLPASEELPEQAAVIVTDITSFEKIQEQSSAFLIAVADVRLAQAKIKQRFDDYQAADTEWDEIHSSAVVHKSAQINRGCRVGPNAVIGANCVLGEDVIIRAGAVIEHGVMIGDNTIINVNANIGYNSVLGDRVTVQAGAIIGSEGYGFAPDANKRYHRIPHTGRVVLGDDVHIGANTCIDRGTYSDTTIARGVKIDNMVHIAHNVEVGEDSLLTSQTSVAGSSKLGKRVIASGQTGVLDHKTVADDVVLVQRCGVIDDIDKAGVWAGTPAVPLKQYVRNLRATKRIERLERQLKELRAEQRDEQH